MSDLIKRLREYRGSAHLCSEAAEKIEGLLRLEESLRNEIKRLREENVILKTSGGINETRSNARGWG